MKQNILTLTMVLSFTALSYTPVVAAQDNAAKRICEYVSVNDSKRLRQFLKSRKLKIRNLFNKLECNKQNLLVFAASSNALDAGEFIIGKLPKRVVKENIDAVAAHSAHLKAKSLERIK